jgi:hypothetical protein
LNIYAPLHILSGEEYLAVYTEPQLHAMAMYRIELADAGYWISAIMSFGPWLIVAGFLIHVSGYFPKFLGILAVLAGFGIAIEGFQFFLAPEHEVIAIPGAILAVVGEFSLCGWFIIKGAKIPSADVDEESMEGKVEPKPETEPEE